jgi:hypothetical protein
MRVEQKVIKPGMSVYEVPHTCSAVIANYYLPSNWYLPTVDGTSTKLLNDLTKFMDDSTPPSTNAIPVADSTPKSSSIIINTADQVASNKQQGGPDNSQKPPVQQSNVPPPKAMPSVKDEIKTFTLEAVKTWFLTVQQQFELSDILALATAFLALFISLILAIRDMYRNCCNHSSQDVSKRLDTRRRVGSLFSRTRDEPLPDIPLLTATATVAPEAEVIRSQRQLKRNRIRSRSHSVTPRRQTTSFSIGSHHVRIND